LLNNLQVDTRRHFCNVLKLYDYGRFIVNLLVEHVSVKTPQSSIAVLAFEDMSPDRDQGYFCDGLAEEIINDLARVEGLRVASRTSSFAYKDRPEDIRVIGQKLNVESVLEGSVRKTDDRLRITTQLINAADGYHIWSKSYDCEVRDVFAIQLEIAHSIAGALEVELSDDEKYALGQTPTASIEAYDFYLRGREFFYRNKRQYILHAIEMFSRAIEKDSGYASASEREQARDDSAKALELAPELSEAHAARGLALAINEQYEEAEKAFERAVALNQELFEAYYFYARTCFVQGKYEQAKDLFVEASRADPADYQSPALLAFLYKTIGQEEKMAPVLREAMDRIERRLALNPDESRAIYLGADVLIRMGEKEKAMEWVKRLAATDRDEPAILYGIACLYSLIGKLEEAVYYLSKSVDAGFAHRQYLEKDGDLDAIRNHSRYTELIEDLKRREKERK
jgi:TolB-like protein/Tfp pilus assembly protein PilF